MKLSEFAMGASFRCGDGLWRVTDIGKRVIVAMRIDRVFETVKPNRRRILNQAEAEAEGWFKGPPYALAEEVFDENDMEGCSPGEERP
jgi:hypothetical protein